MRTLSGLLAFACLLALLPGVSPAAVSLGTNLGLTIHTPKGGSDNTTIMEFPSSAGNLQPGLRLGFLTSDPHHGMYLNTGLVYLSNGGRHSDVIELTGNYQYNFSPEASATPYLTAGGGLLSVGGTGESATSALLGGGFGVSTKVAEGHGTIRMEVRYDRITEGGTIIDEAGMIGFRLGFDLWMN